MITHLCTAFSTFNVLLEHVNIFQDIYDRNQAGFCFFWPQKSSKTTKICWRTWLSHTKLLHWSGSMSESRKRVKIWARRFAGKFIHISYYFVQLSTRSLINYHFIHYFHFINNSIFIKINIKMSYCPVTLKKYDIKKLLKIYMTLILLCLGSGLVCAGLATLRPLVGILLRLVLRLCFRIVF